MSSIVRESGVLCLAIATGLRTGKLMAVTLFAIEKLGSFRMRLRVQSDRARFAPEARATANFAGRVSQIAGLDRKAIAT